MYQEGMIQFPQTIDKNLTPLLFHYLYLKYSNEFNVLNIPLIYNESLELANAKARVYQLD